MKKISSLMAFVGLSIFVQAQKDSSAINLSKFETIPSFHIYTVPDSSDFSNKNLKKNKPFVIMFFSPDCYHCINETKDLLAYKNELKDIQILMASLSSYEVLKTFYQEYELSSMPNIKMGQDVNYVLGSLFHLKTFPSIFVYDQKGRLAKAFAGNIEIPAILDAVK